MCDIFIFGISIVFGGAGVSGEKSGQELRLATSCYRIGDLGSDPSDHIYALLTKCKVKMAGYWPSSFSVSVNKNEKKNEANIQ